MPARALVARCMAVIACAGAAATAHATASSCATPPAATQPKDLKGIAPPNYLAFVPTAETVLDVSYFAWDESQIPPFGGTDTPDEVKRGKHWRFYGRLADSCTDDEQAWATLAPAFAKAGWQLVKKYDRTPKNVVLRYTRRDVDAWINVQVAQSQSRGIEMQVIEVGPPPIHLKLAAPAATPEPVDPAKGDFPYLAPLPGSHFKGGHHDTTPLYFDRPWPQPSELVATGFVGKTYDPPEGTSQLEVIAVYHEALVKAGWSIVNEKRNELIKAHYGKNGRSLWAYLHVNYGGYDITVGDEGGLETALAHECHAALTGVLFDFDKATLKPESDAVLERVLALFKKDAALKLEIQGHTDNVGEDKYNQTLSEQRAAAVVTWLAGHGVAAARLSSSGYGRTRPVADNKTDEGRARNRRVEIANPACKAKGT